MGGTRGQTELNVFGEIGGWGGLVEAPREKESIPGNRSRDGCRRCDDCFKVPPQNTGKIGHKDGEKKLKSSLAKTDILFFK